MLKRLRATCCRISLALVATSFLATSVLATPADEGFKRLSAPEVRAVFTGHVFTDDVHFTDRYQRDGGIESFAMGRKLRKTWRLEKHLLCITESTGEYCHAVWKKGAAIRLVQDGVSITTEGSIK